MIIQFTAGNYGSFDQSQTLNFRATGLDSLNEKVETSNVVNLDGQRFLKIVGIYGANASGKSNLLRAMALFKEMIVQSMVSEDFALRNVNPFRQSKTGPDQSSFFQIVLLLDNKKYRYGFTLKKDGKIDSEWLFGPAVKNETYYFKRVGDQFDINEEWFPEGYSLPMENLRDDALYLTFCSTYNVPIARNIRTFFAKKVSSEVPIRKAARRAIAVGGIYSLTNKLVEEGQEVLILTWLKEVGLNYKGIVLTDVDDLTKRTFLVKHIYDEAGNSVGDTQMDLNVDESEGTKKFYMLIGKLHRKFTEGGLFIVDEIDSNFHPSLLQKIIKLFQNPEINQANAQLLFTSHDTSLMDPELMRRDQFYFTEKNICDSTRLYSLADLKGIRNNADFARQYLAGIYGALPILGNYLEDATEEGF
jgi:AAA15 family ATPase/GTPase